jgi:diguanylate cyclase (GGDEF)-like protein
MSAIDAELLAEVLRHAPDAVAVVDGAVPGDPIVYANATLATLLKRSDDWVIGRGLGEIESDAPCNGGVSAAPVRLACADGSTVSCERWESRLSADRRAVFYRPQPKLAFDATQGVPSLAGDRSGLATPEHLLEVLRRDWAIAQRDASRITVMRFDLDAFRGFHEVFGRGATDNAVRQVGKTIALAMRRASDLVARFDDDEFVVLALAMEPEAALQRAEEILAKVRALAIHHPRSPIGRYLSLSCGVVTVVPSKSSSYETILDAATKALIKAKGDGGNRVVGGELK